MPMSLLHSEIVKLLSVRVLKPGATNEYLSWTYWRAVVELLEPKLALHLRTSWQLLHRDRTRHSHFGNEGRSKHLYLAYRKQSFF